MTADLVIYAVVAAGLVVWLKSILGTKHGDERERPNPYTQLPDNPVEKDNVVTLKASEVTVLQENKIADLVNNPTDTLSISATAQEGLVAISKTDKTFDIKDFLGKTQDAFAIIVESFAEGDRDTLQALLSSNVYDTFNDALIEREGREETMATDIHAIDKAEVLEASLSGRNARVTIRFVARETSVTRDKDGTVIAGHPDKVSEMRDVWVFGRDVRSRDPRWIVHETKGDIIDDNETIPNTDNSDNTETTPQE